MLLLGADEEDIIELVRLLQGFLFSCLFLGLILRHHFLYTTQRLVTTQ